LLADQSSAAAMVASLRDTVRRFEDGADASDDLTVLAFRYLGANPG
jgi:serine phosphatase RsbU (regulator of sigma subunit)